MSRTGLRIGAIAAILAFAAGMAASARWEAWLAQSSLRTNALLAWIGLSVLAAGYFVPRAIRTFSSPDKG